MILQLLCFIVLVTRLCSALPASSGLITSNQESVEDYRLIPHEKRQLWFGAKRGADIVYHCPVGGDQLRTFAWRAEYHTVDLHVNLYKVHNIDSFGHVEWIANDFASQFTSQFAQGYEEYCCLYVVHGVTVGAVYDHHMDMTLGQRRIDGGYVMTIDEICVHVVPNHTCPAKMFVLHGSLARCELIHVHVFEME